MCPVTPETVVLPLFCILPLKVRFKVSFRASQYFLQCVNNWCHNTAATCFVHPVFRLWFYCVAMVQRGPTSAPVSPLSHISTPSVNGCHATELVTLSVTLTPPSPLKKKRKKGLHQTLGTMFFGYITQRNPTDQNTDNKK